MTVTVIDEEEPGQSAGPRGTIGCPTDAVLPRVQQTEANEHYAQVPLAYADVTAVDNSGAINVITYAGSGTTGYEIRYTTGLFVQDTESVQPEGAHQFEVGNFGLPAQHTIKYSAIDPSDNRGDCSVTITVSDGQDPVLACPPDLIGDGSGFATDAGQSYFAVALQGVASCADIGAAGTTAGDQCTAAADCTWDSVNTVCTVTDPVANANLHNGAACTDNTACGIIEAHYGAINGPLITEGATAASYNFELDNGNTQTHEVYFVAKDSPCEQCQQQLGQNSVGCSTYCSTSNSNDPSQWDGGTVAGNVGHCVWTVVVKDTEAPVLTCPTQIVASSATGADSSITGSDLNLAVALPTDASTSPNQVEGYGYKTLTIKPAGVADNSGAVVDNNGLPFVATMVGGPVCTGSDDGTTTPCALNGAGTACNVVGGNCAYDAAPIVPITGAERFPIGSTDVTYTATDNSGNSGSCVITVIIEDVEDPILDCPDDLIMDTDPGQPYVTFNLPTPDSGTGTGHIADNSGSVTYLAVIDVAADGVTPLQPSIVPMGNPVNRFYYGDTTVVYTATDPAGRQSTCLLAIEVRDVELPVLACPNDITRNTDGPNGAAATCTGSDDGAGSPCTLNGDSTACDVQGPLCVYTPETDNGPFVGFPFRTMPIMGADTSVTDNAVFGAIPPLIVTASINNVDISIGTTSVGFDFPIGVTVVRYFATDLAAHSSTTNNLGECFFTVTIEDNENPVMSCPPDVTVSTSVYDANNLITGRAASNPSGAPSAVVDLVAATVRDNSEEVLTVVGTTGPQSFNIGAHTVTYTAADSHGQSSSCDVIVTVEDTESPILICPTDVQVELLANNRNYRELTVSTDLGLAVVTDNNDLPGVSVPVATVEAAISGSPVDVTSGTHNFPCCTNSPTTVTYTATDAAGNVGTCTMIVSVVDVQNPVLTCGAVPSLLTFPTSMANPSGVAYHTLVMAGPSIADNSGETLVATAVIVQAERIESSLDATQDAQGALLTPVAIVYDAQTTAYTHNFYIGTSMVRFTATDSTGRSGSCVTIVNVVDNEEPVIVNSVVVGTTRHCIPEVKLDRITGSCQDSNGDTVDVQPLCEAVIVNLQGSTWDSVAGICVKDNGDTMSAPEACMYTNVNTWLYGHHSWKGLIPRVTITDNSGAVIAPVAYLGNPVSNVVIPVSTEDPTKVGPVELPISQLTFGQAIITFTATDAQNNEVSCELRVLVSDIELPVLTCPSDATINTVGGNTADVLIPGAVVVDNSETTDGQYSGVLSATAELYNAQSNQMVQQTIGSTQTFTLDGSQAFTQYAITYTSSDAAGNENTCLWTLRIGDDSPPVVICPSDETADTSGLNTAEVGLKRAGQPGGPTASDNSLQVGDPYLEVNNGLVNTFTRVQPAPAQCGQIPYASRTHNSCSTAGISCDTDGRCADEIIGVFAIGTHTVTYTAADAAGNTGFCTMQVVVRDMEPPTVVCPSNLRGESGHVTTNTNSPTKAIVLQKLGGTGSSAVLDNSCHPNNPCTAIFAIPSVLDSSNNRIPLVTAQNLDVNGNNVLPYDFPIGTTEVLYTAIDPSNQQGICVQYIEVRDTEAPRLSCPLSNTYSTRHSKGDALVTIHGPSDVTVLENSGEDLTSAIDATFTRDWHPDLETSVNLDGGSTQQPNQNEQTVHNGVWAFPIGITTVRYHVTDTAGNEGSCTIQLVVEDVQVPVLTCPNIPNANTNVDQPVATVGIMGFGSTSGVLDNNPADSNACAYEFTSRSGVDNSAKCLSLAGCTYDANADTCTGEVYLVPHAEYAVGASTCSNTVGWMDSAIGAGCDAFDDPNYAASHCSTSSCSAATSSAADCDGAGSCTFDPAIAPTCSGTIPSTCVGTIPATCTGAAAGCSSVSDLSSTTECDAVLNAVTHVFSVADAGGSFGNQYFADGNQAPAVEVYVNDATVLDWSHVTAQAHPIKISNTAGMRAECTACASWITYDTANFQTTITVPSSYTGDLFYYCEVHVAMGVNPITIATTQACAYAASDACAVNGDGSACLVADAVCTYTVSSACALSGDSTTCADQCLANVPGADCGSGYDATSCSTVDGGGACTWTSGGAPNCAFDSGQVATCVPRLGSAGGNPMSAEAACCACNGGSSAPNAACGVGEYFSSGDCIAVIETDTAIDFPIGPTAVTYYATDSHRNTGNCIATVTVVDNQAPDLVCPADISVFNDATLGFSAIDVDNSVVFPTIAANGVSDNSGADLASTIKPNILDDFSCADYSGQCLNNVPGDGSPCHDGAADATSCSLVDGGGSCTWTSGRAGNTLQEQCEALPACTFDSSDDSCSGSFYSELTGTTTFQIGRTVVYFTAEDAANNVGFCTINVDVVDNEPPVLTCPADVSVSADAGHPFSIVTLNHAVVADNSGVNTADVPNIDPASPVGGCADGSTPAMAGISYTTENWIIATSEGHDLLQMTGTLAECQAACDADPACAGFHRDLAIPAGDQDHCYLKNSVTGTNAPPGTSICGATCGTYVQHNSDLCDDRSAVLTIIPFTHEFLMGACPNNFPYHVTNNAFGWAGIMCFDNAQGAAASTGADGMWCLFQQYEAEPRAAILAAEVADTSKTAGYCNPILPKSATTVLYTATDLAGNVGSCTMTVTVLDNEAATLTCPVDQFVVTDMNQPTATVAFDLAGVVDNSGTTLYAVTDIAEGPFPIGATVLTYSATDASGNVGTCQINVVNDDSEAPILACPNDLAADSDSGESYATLTLDLPGVTDNSGEVPTATAIRDQPNWVDTNGFDCTPFNADANHAQVYCGDSSIADANGVTVAQACRACGGGEVISASPTPTFQLGSTVVTYEATDSVRTSNLIDGTPVGTGDNTGFCTYVITISDNQVPGVVCPPNQVQYTNQPVGGFAVGDSFATITLSTATVTDNSAAVLMALASVNGYLIGPNQGSGLTQQLSDLPRPAFRYDGESFPSHAYTSQATIVDVKGPNIASQATATSPDGFSPDTAGGAGEADVTIDGDVSTYWDQDNNVAGPHILQFDFSGPTTIGAYSFEAFGANDFAPKTWRFMCDGVEIDAQTDFDWTTNNANAQFEALVFQQQCTTVQMRITAWYGASPAVKEFGLHAGSLSTTGLLADCQATCNTDAACGGFLREDVADTASGTCWSVADITQAATAVPGYAMFVRADTGSGTVIQCGDFAGRAGSTNVEKCETWCGSLNCGCTMDLGTGACTGYPAAVYDVVYSATDVESNTGTCTLQVTIIDTQIPVLSCPGPQTAYTAITTTSAPITLVDAVVTDNSGEVLTATAALSDGTAITIGVETAFPWTGTAPREVVYVDVIYSATDSSGNTGTCTVTMTVPELDDCGTQPCVHGGCTDQIGGYLCSCDPGWTGADCDVDIDECAASPCQAPGTSLCQDSTTTKAGGNTGETMGCQPGDGNEYAYNSESCGSTHQMTIDPGCALAVLDGTALACTSAATAGGGCTHTPAYDLCIPVNTYVCTCMNRYEGFDCEFLDECSFNPCHVEDDFFKNQGPQLGSVVDPTRFKCDAAEIVESFNGVTFAEFLCVDPDTTVTGDFYCRCPTCMETIFGVQQAAELTTYFNAHPSMQLHILGEVRKDQQTNGECVDLTIPREGCTDPLATNYDSLANQQCDDPPSAAAALELCVSSDAVNVDTGCALAAFDGTEAACTTAASAGGGCTYTAPACPCQMPRLGCMIPGATNYVPTANRDDPNNPCIVEATPTDECAASPCESIYYFQTNSVFPGGTRVGSTDGVCEESWICHEPNQFVLNDYTCTCPQAVCGLDEVFPGVTNFDLSIFLHRENTLKDHLIGRITEPTTVGGCECMAAWVVDDATCSVAATTGAPVCVETATFAGTGPTVPTDAALCAAVVDMTTGVECAAVAGGVCTYGAAFNGCGMSPPCNGDDGGVAGNSYCEVVDPTACTPAAGLGGMHDYCTPANWLGVSGRRLLQGGNSTDCEGEGGAACVNASLPER